MNVEKLPAFTPEARAALAQAMGDDDAPDIIRQVERGEAELWRIDGASYLVTRIEQYTNGAELCIVAGAGKGCRSVVRAVVERARTIKNMRRVRFHSRSAIYRIVRPLGFTELHRVYALDVGRELQQAGDRHG